MIIKLNKNNVSDLEDYLLHNMNNTIEILRAYEKTGIVNNSANKDSGDYYAYMVEGKIEGILLFTNNKQLFLSYNNKNMLKKFDLLKLIKEYRPIRISGSKEEVHALYLTMNRVFKDATIKNYHYMVLDEPKSFDKKDYIIMAKPSDVMEELIFFLEVEKSFKRSHMTINKMKDKIKNNIYILYKKNEIYAQGFIENNVSEFYQIGGIYTSKNHRNKGCAGDVLEYLIDYIQSEDKKALLAVMAENHAAIKLYEKYGFKNLVEFMVIE